MFIRPILIAILLLAGQATYAAGTMTMLEQAYEIQASSITLPAEVGRSVFVRPCSTCAGKRHEIVASTRYWVNGEEVSLSEMRKAMNSDPNAYLGVAYSIEDKHLTWVRLISSESQGSETIQKQRDQRDRRPGTSRTTS